MAVIQDTSKLVQEVATNQKVASTATCQLLKKLPTRSTYIFRRKLDVGDTTVLAFGVHLEHHRRALRHVEGEAEEEVGDILLRSSERQTSELHNVRT